jgi:hypothetical protein
LAFMLVRYRFSMALWAAFLRFITALMSESVAVVEDLDVVVDEALEGFRDVGIMCASLMGVDDTGLRSELGERLAGRSVLVSPRNCGSTFNGAGD